MGPICIPEKPRCYNPYMITKSRFAWGWLCGLLIADIVFPWYVLSGQARFAGAFLFWVVWIIIAIASMFVFFLRWRE